MKKAASGIMCNLLLIGMLISLPYIQPVKSDSSRVGEMGTATLLSTFDGDTSRSPKNPSVKESIDGKPPSSDFGNGPYKIGARDVEWASEKPTTWYSPDGDLPTTFNQTDRRSSVPSIERIYKTDFSETFTDLVCILVDSSVYDGIEASIGQFIVDVEASGFSVELYSGSWGSPEDTREFLHTQLQNGIVGTILVGDIPSAWFEMDHTDPLWPLHEEFPIDLYYMDLDGTWIDADADGLYDTHGGNVEPEIWVGRLKASNIVGDEVSLLNNYFQKNHFSRIGTLSAPQRALVYVDDDWVAWAEEDGDALRQICPQTIVVKDEATTNSDDYKTRITQGYEWVHLRCHGSSGSHTFKADGVWDGTVYSLDYLSIDPPVLFYQLFVCSGARYVETNYLGGACIFADTYGILAVGSTKTGGMRFFDDFYGPLSEEKCIGAAFQEWFQNWGESDPKWYYGLTILGDPTLYLPRMYADFTANPTSGPEPLTVRFTDISTSRDGITAWEWDFENDGVVDSTEQNPIHVYDQDGVYTVTLQVYDGDGNSDIETKINYITVMSAGPANPPGLPPGPATPPQLPPGPANSFGLQLKPATMGNSELVRERERR